MSKPEPMDPSFNESSTGQVHVNHKRNAYALVQLLDEVRQLYPEIPYEFCNYNGRNTALSVLFDLTGIDNDEASDFTKLILLIKSDQRILDVVADDGQVLVDLFPSPRYQDLQDSFHLADAYWILTGDDQ